MDKAIEIIVSWIQKNLKNPKLYVGLVALVFIVALVFPYIDANFFFHNRIERRIDILQSLTQIDLEKISESPVLQEEYNAILSDLKNQSEWVFSGTSGSRV